MRELETDKLRIEALLPTDPPDSDGRRVYDCTNLKASFKPSCF